MTLSFYKQHYYDYEMASTTTIATDRPQQQQQTTNYQYFIYFTRYVFFLSQKVSAMFQSG